MTVSVIIPTLNRPAALERALAALSWSNFPRREFEVIVVDDGGSVDLRHIVDRFRDGIDVKVIRQSNLGPAAARNAGARAARGRFLAFTDDDCEPDESWVSALVAALCVTNDALIGGRVVNGLPSNPYAEASQIISDFCHSHFNRDPSKGRFYPSNNFGVPAELYRRTGEFDESFSVCGGEDREFCDRWLGLGLKLVWAPGAVITHRHEMNCLGFWRQHSRYGQGGLHFARAKRRRNGGWVQFEGWRFHLGIVLVPFRVAQPGRALHLSALTLLSQAAVAAGYAWEWSRTRRADRPALRNSGDESGG
jgi:glycosyltransferase involved in cell wall biosynthesis